MNYHKNTDSSAPPRREGRKRPFDSTVVLLSKHGFRIETHKAPLSGAPKPTAVRGTRPKRKR